MTVYSGSRAEVDWPGQYWWWLLQMNVCVLNARLYLVSPSCRKWRSEPSKCRDLASKCGRQHRKLHRFGTLFYHFVQAFSTSFFSISLWSVHPKLRAKTWEQVLPMHFKCHMSCCCWSAVLQEYVSSQRDWPGFSLSLPARSWTHLLALHIKR